ncbi:hypothetical protein E3N88_09691 [Mikania micrantha]|uniref:Retroviral polymerase SH3-like domain-containing protein n=1 Tax=Mikania micrantha TaxID=192012 RepID=A0A5N6PMV4_9ASTR|nr:hypothetical protein E3N88_09691 [Mikania micrantha]
MTRSILRAMKLPQYLWADGVRHAVYLLNRLPTKALEDTTPYKVFKGIKPNLKHVKVFGCIGYVKRLATGLRKLDDRNLKMVHLGSQLNTKAYRMLDPTTGKIHVTRDVSFDESRGWMWNTDHERNESGKDHALGSGSNQIGGPI